MKTLSSLVELYNLELTKILDKHAPDKSRVVTIRPAAPWYNTEITSTKRIHRKLERKWRKSKLPDDRLRFIKQNRIVNQLLHSTWSQYYSALIEDNCSNQKRLFDIVGKLLHHDPEPLYPSCASNADFAYNFINFFGFNNSS